MDTGSRMDPLAYRPASTVWTAVAPHSKCSVVDRKFSVTYRVGTWYGVPSRTALSHCSVKSLQLFLMARGILKIVHRACLATTL